MSVWSKDEAMARALEMDSFYAKTKFEGYRYERDKWTEIAKEADYEMRKVQGETPLSGA